MSPVQNVWRQLVQRRLWPVAILLVAGLAAVPLMLAEEPEPAAAPPPAAKTGGNELATEPIVALAAAEDRAKPRRVLGKPKNPFAVPEAEESATNEKASSKDAAGADAEKPAQAPSSTGGGSTESGGSESGGGSSPSGSGSPEPTAPEPAAPKPAPKTYTMHELTVRFGDSSGELGRRSLERLQALPSEELPVLIYLGVLEDGKTAVFLVDHGVTAIGDGDCSPTPDTCETIRLRAGETEFLDVKDAAGEVTAQYQLDLIKIHERKTTSAERAAASYAGKRSGQRLLKARVAGEGPLRYRWDAKAGTLEKRPGRVLGALVSSATVALR